MARKAKKQTPAAVVNEKPPMDGYIELPKGTFLCRLCVFLTTDKTTFEQHQQYAHLIQPLNQPVKTDPVPQQSQLEQAMQHANDKLVFHANHAQCTKCNARFARLDWAQKHVLIFHHVRNLRCDSDQCHFKCKYIIKMARHSARSHRILSNIQRMGVNCLSRTITL